MSDEMPDAEPADEQKLGRYMAELREADPLPSQELAKRVRARAGWQRVIRGPLHAVGFMLGAAVDGVIGIFGFSANRR